VVGMSKAIHDHAARSFAIGFYGGLGEHESIAVAFRPGKAAINLDGLRDADRPQVKVGAGMDARQLVLAAVERPFRPEARSGRPQARCARSSGAQRSKSLEASCRRPWISMRLHPLELPRRWNVEGAAVVRCVRSCVICCGVGRTYHADLTGAVLDQKCSHSPQ